MLHQIQSHLACVGGLANGSHKSPVRERHAETGPAFSSHIFLHQYVSQFILFHTLLSTSDIQVGAARELRANPSRIAGPLGPATSARSRTCSRGGFCGAVGTACQVRQAASSATARGAATGRRTQRKWITEPAQPHEMADQPDRPCVHNFRRSSDATLRAVVCVSHCRGTTSPAAPMAPKGSICQRG